MKALSLVSLVLCTAGLLHAAEPSKFVLPDPVAVVEGKPISASDVQATMNSLIARSGKQAADLTDAQKLQAARDVVNDLVAQIIVGEKAASLTVSDADVDAAYQKFVSQFPDPAQFEEQLKTNNMTIDGVKGHIRDGLRDKQWVDSQLKGKLDITDAEANAFYTSHKDFFEVPEEVRASHILIIVPADATPDTVAEKQKLIDEAAARVAKGEDFAAVAKDVSEDPVSKEKGGDLDYFPRKALVPEFTDVAFSLKDGEVSKTVKTKFGFHIIKATGHKAPRTVPFEEAKQKIVAYLADQKRSLAVAQLLKEIRASAKVTNNLPPEQSPGATIPALSGSSPEVKPVDKK